MAGLYDSFNAAQQPSMLYNGLYGVNGMQADIINGGLSQVSVPSYSYTNITSGDNAQPQSQSNIGGTLNTASNAVSTVNNASKLVNNISALKSGVNQFGSDYLGLASGGIPQGAEIASSLGPAEGNLFTAADIGSASGMTLSGALGWAGIGATVGSFNPLAKNKTGGQIGGAIGAVAGDAIGGPIGGAIGSFLGSTIGGMLGPQHPATKADEFTGFMDATGSFGKNLGFADKNGYAGGQSAARQVSMQAQMLGKTLAQHGIDTNGLKIRGGVNTQQAGGGFIDFGTGDQSDAQLQRIKFDPANPSSMRDAIQQVGNAILKMKGSSLTMDAFSQGNQPGSNLINGGMPMIKRNHSPNQYKSFVDYTNAFRQQQKAGAA